LELILIIAILFFIILLGNEKKEEISLLKEICSEDIGKECIIKKAISFDDIFGSKIKGELFNVEKDWVKIKTIKNGQPKIRLIRISDIKEIQFNA